MARTPKPPAESPAPSPKEPKERATFHLPAALLDEVRDAVVALSGPPTHLTLAAFAESAFRAELARLVRKHHDGAPFPRRTTNVRVGRPIGS